MRPNAKISARQAAFVLIVLSCLGALERPLLGSRAALVGSGGGEQVENVLALAEARLTDSPAIQLVERRELDRIVAEQKLSLAGLVQGEQAVRAGKVLSAQLLAILDANGSLAAGTGPATSPAGQVNRPGARVEAGLIIFDADTGVRLWDTALDLRDGAKAAEAVAGAMVASEHKRRRGLTDLRSICVLAARNADLPRGMDGFCDAVGGLLERELVASPALAVLERSRLDQVNREAALTGAARGNEFLASVVVASLEISRPIGGKDKAGLHATAILSDVKGRTLGKAEFSVDTQDAVGLARGLGESIARELKVVDEAAPAGVAQGVGIVRTNPFDRALEAARFYREATLLAEHRDFDRALPAAEAALALAPDDHVMQAMLARSLIDHGLAQYRAKWIGHDGSPIRGKADGAFDAAPPTLLRGAELLADVDANLARDTPEACAKARLHLWRGADDLLAYVTIVRWQERAADPLAGPSKYLQAAKAGLRKYVLGEEQVVELPKVHDQMSFQAYSLWLAQALRDDEWVYSRDSAEWTEDLSTLVDNWLVLLKRFGDEKALPPVPAASPYVPDVLEQATYGWLCELHRGWPVFGPNDHRTIRCELTAADRERLSALSRRLASYRSPRIAVYSALCQMSLDVERDKALPEKMREDIGVFVKDIERRIEGRDPEHSPSPDERLLYYTLIVQANELLDATDFHGMDATEALNFMLSRNEVADRVLWPGFRSSPRWLDPTEAEMARRLDVARRITAVLNDPASQVLEGDRARMLAAFRPDLENLRTPPGAVSRVDAVAAWSNRATLIDVFTADHGLQFLSSPLVAPRGGRDGAAVVYALGLSSNKPTGPPDQLQLLRFMLDGRPPEVLATMHAALNPNIAIPPPGHRAGANAQFTAACLDENWYAVGTQTNGVLLLPFNSTDQPRLLDESNGLPTPRVTALAALKGKLYAGLGREEQEGYLVGYDFQTRATETVASSQRKDAQSPFDDSTPFIIKHMAADPERNRLLVMIQRNEPELQLDGLWEYKPDEPMERRWRRLLPIRLGKLPATPNNRSPISMFFWGSAAWSGEGKPAQIWYSAAGELFRFKLANDTAEVFSRPRQLMSGSMLPRGTAVYRDRDAGRFSHGMLKGTLGAYALIDDWIWSATNPYAWTRVSLKDGHSQALPPLRENVTSFVPATLDLLPDGKRVLVGDGSGLWLLTVRSDESK